MNREDHIDPTTQNMIAEQVLEDCKAKVKAEKRESRKEA